MSPFPTPCKGKSKSQPFAHTFALTGRGRLYTDTQGVALGCGLAALSGRSFSRFVRLSCAHALPPCYLLSKPRRDFLERLRPDIVVERFTSQSPADLLLAPEWGLKNYQFVELVKKRLEQRDTWQGRLYKGAERD